MNCTVVRFLYDQFHKLNDEFSRCIGDRGEFRGIFERFRRRHQAISRSVQEADRFLMITNLALFCGEIANIVLIVYTAIFHQNYIMSFGAQAAVVYLTWLGVNVLALSLAAALAAIINHIVSNT